jgi:hypothetical protein
VRRGKKKAPGAVRTAAGRDDARVRRRLAQRCRRWARRLDLSTAALAVQVGLSARTLRAWARASGAAPRGRHRHVISAVEGRLMRTAIGLHGDAVSVTTLQAWCPQASRRAILQWRTRERRRRRRQLHVVHWRHAGRIWAIDISQPAQPIDGTYRYIVHVRDLGSQCHLAAIPIARATAMAVCAVLRALIATADAPLVLKLDNGAPFVSAVTRAWARTVGTTLLYSPPRYPRYNGAIEASIGALTTRLHHAAVAAGHPHYWTCDDLEHARMHANAVRPSHRRCASLERWRSATRITTGERARFQSRYAAALSRYRMRPTCVQQRHAIVDTLQMLGYVSITRRTDLVHH